MKAVRELRGWVRARRVAALFACLCLASAHLGLAASQQFEADCAAFTTHSHRLAGTVEGRAAADYVAKRLEQIGVDLVIRQPFPAAQTTIGRCELVLGREDGPAERLALLPCRPNGIISPVAPPQGLSGPLLHAGTGAVGAFGDRSPEGAIVVLDYNCGDNWLRAFRLGARAVVFVSEAPEQSWHSHGIEADANLPRFYFAGAREALPEGRHAVIHSELTWQTMQAGNVVGVIRGTDPVFQLEQPEAIVLAANIDSFGDVPRLSPGARAAANCAGLLGIAEYLVTNRPRRHMVIAFLDNQARGHAGCAAFYAALDQDDLAGPQARLESIEQESAFLAKLDAALAADHPLTAADADVRRQLQVRLKETAGEYAYDATAALVELREQRYEADAAGRDEAEREAQIEQLEATKFDWNQVRRHVAQFEEPAPGTILERFQTVCRAVARDTAVRGEELVSERAAAEAGLALGKELGSAWICAHVSLLFGDASPRWGLVIGGDSDWHSAKDNPGLYGKVQRAFLGAAEACVAAGLPLPGFETRSADGTLTPARILWAAPHLVHSGEVAGGYGIFNLALATSQESLPREGTPGDALRFLSLDTVEAQARMAGRVLAAFSSEEGLSMRRPIEKTVDYVAATCRPDGRIDGPAVMARSPGSAVPNKRVPDATIKLCLSPRRDADAAGVKRICAFDNFRILRTDRNGSYSYGPVPPDPHHSRVNGFAVSLDSRGQVEYASSMASARTTHTRLNLFVARGGSVALPPGFGRLPTLVMNAVANAPLESEKSFFKTQEGVVYWYAEDKVDAVKLFGLRSTVLLLNGPAGLDLETDGPAEGEGYSLAGDPGFPIASRQAAGDVWRLNESRMSILRSRGVVNSSVEELHGRSEDLLLDAAQARTTAEDEALASSSFLAATRVYTRTRGDLDDLVRAVLILLALCVPFAFAMERLVIGGTTIYRRLLGFVGFFLATFLILYFTHPAFAVSSTPVIIFLGFAIVLLSCLVIGVIMNKFEVELKVLQGMRSTVHAADVSRLSTTLAAMHMGISTMRRRPLRTALTAVTIVLLTFTILCFASFGTKIGIIDLFVAPAPSYSGVMVHDVNWAELEESVLELVVGRWGAEATVAARYWLSPQAQSDPGVIVTRADGSTPVSLRGVLGVDARELAHRPDLAAILRVGDAGLADRVWMTSAVADSLGVEPGAEVIVKGQRLTVAPVLDATVVISARDLDGSSLLPVDFSAMDSGQHQSGGGAETPDASAMRLQDQNWAYLPVDSVLIVSTVAAERMGAALRAISVYTGTGPEAVAMAEDLARIAPLPVAATREDGVYRHVLGSVMQASGIRDLFFPLVLGGLVIFGTMLGSVADREREIYTFSALGLAPPHVASLFFSEAMVFSVIGGLAGYLLAQASMKVLQLLAQYGLVRVPELNYSSMNAIVTILVVMATVLVSAIYPALKASRSANPGLLRAWRVPAPEGDVLSLLFPFTVSSYDITGVVSFLKEHFDNYSDSGMGTFIARETRIAAPEEGEADVGLKARLALAPFDLGVTQAFHLHSTASEIPGIDEVRITLTRASGQPKDWRRLNKVLLDDLRKQFLIWRSLPHETMELYRERTLQETGNGSGGKAESE